MKILTKKLPIRIPTWKVALTLGAEILSNLFLYGCAVRDHFDFGKLPKGIDPTTAEIVTYLIKTGKKVNQGFGRPDGFAYRKQFSLSEGRTAILQYNDRTTEENFRSNQKINRGDFLEVRVCKPIDFDEGENFDEDFSSPYICDNFLDNDLDGNPEKYNGKFRVYGQDSEKYQSLLNEILGEIK